MPGPRREPTAAAAEGGGRRAAADGDRTDPDAAGTTAGGAGGVEPEPDSDTPITPMRLGEPGGGGASDTGSETAVDGTDGLTEPGEPLPGASTRRLDGAGSRGRPAAVDAPAPSVDSIVASIADSVGESADGTAGAHQPTSAAGRPSAIDDAWAEVDRQPSGWSARSGQSRVSERPPADAEPARLVGLGGVTAGLEIALDRELVVGRSAGCGIVVGDPSVSREHARVGRDGGHWVVADARSANGTFVNGERVTRRRVASGDEVTFGQASFRFVEPGAAAAAAGDRRAAARAATAESRGRATSWYVVSSVLIVLFAAVVALGIVWLRRHSSGPARPTAAHYFAAGAAAVEKRQWTAAQAQFELCLGLDPDSDAARRFLARIEREKAFERQLAAARAAFGRGELVPAYTQAAAIAESVYTPDARELAGAIDRELERREERARAALEAGRGQEALDLLGPSAALRPSRPEVAALLARARSSAAAPGRVPESTASPGSGAGPERQPSPSALAAEEAVHLFAAGEVERALAKAQSAAGRESDSLAAEIRELQRVYAQAQDEYRAKRADRAIALLEQAKALDESITGPLASTVRAGIRKKLADMYYVRGIDAVLAEHWRDAAHAFRTALSNDPSHGASRRKLDQLVSRGVAGEP